MGQLIKIIRLIFIFIFLTFNLYSTEIVKVALGEWRPYISQTTNENLMERIISEVFEIQDIKYEIEYMPWGETYKKTLSGEAHLTFPWIKTKERDQNFLFVPEPFFKEDYVFFYKKGKEFIWKNFDDLKKYKFGSIKGYYQYDYYKKLGIEFVEADTESINLGKILSGEIDAYLASYRVTINLIKRDFAEQEELFENDLSPFSYIYSYIMVSRNIAGAQELVNKITEGLREIKNSGRYEQIVNEFFEEYY